MYVRRQMIMRLVMYNVFCNISHICNYSSSQYHALLMSVMKIVAAE